MSNKRASTLCLFRHRTFKKQKLIFDKQAYRIIRKRKISEISDISLNYIIQKRKCLELSDIYLSINEINCIISEKHQIYISSSNLMSYTFSNDPRDIAATDIQRIFRGWSQRKKRLVFLNQIN